MGGEISRRKSKYLCRSILEPTTGDRLLPALNFLGLRLLTDEVPAPDCCVGVAERLDENDPGVDEAILPSSWLENRV